MFARDLSVSLLQLFLEFFHVVVMLLLQCKSGGEVLLFRRRSHVVVRQLIGGQDERFQDPSHAPLLRLLQQIVNIELRRLFDFLGPLIRRPLSGLDSRIISAIQSGVAQGRVRGLIQELLRCLLAELSTVLLSLAISDFGK